LGGVGYQWVRGGHKERVKKGKYGRSILYSCMKIKSFTTGLENNYCRSEESRKNIYRGINVTDRLPNMWKITELLLDMKKHKPEILRQ
jgi:hypothetical protein